MTQQLSLSGFEQPAISNSSHPGFDRRRTDRQRAEHCYPEALVDDSNQVSRDTPLVSIFTLGRFSLLLNGKPAEFGRKAPKRSLEMLKAIVAQGGREISTISLMSALWPEVDGDTAQRSFDTTLHRLRKMLGDSRVLVLKDGRLSLDSRYCWVDVWSFERLLGQSNRLLIGDYTGKQIFSVGCMTDNLTNLYLDHFLAKEELTSWSVSMHERLRSKFIHHLAEVGRYLEKHGFYERAMRCYRKGISVDDLVEVFYQRLMACCLETGYQSEGLAVYRSCCQVLSVTLGLQPEPETEALYRALKASRLEQQSA